MCIRDRSHGSPVNFSGLMFHALEYNVREDNGLIDYDQMEEVLSLIHI